MNLWEAASSPDGCEAIKRSQRMPCEATFPDNTCQTSLLIDKAGLVEEMCPSAEKCWILGRLKVRTITTFDPNRARLIEGGIGTEILPVQRLSLFPLSAGQAVSGGL